MWLNAWSWSCTTTSPTLPRHHRREVRRSHHGAFGEALADAGSATIPSSWDCSCTQLVPGVQVPLPNHREYHSKHPMYGGRKKCVSPACFLTLIKNACMAWWNEFIIRRGRVERGRRSLPPLERLDFYVWPRRPSSYPSRRSNPHSVSTRPQQLQLHSSWRPKTLSLSNWQGRSSYGGTWATKSSAV